MDAVHQPDSRLWIGERIKVADFKKNWMEALKKFDEGQDDDHVDIRKALMRRMNISECELKALEEDCGPHQLSCGEESLDPGEIPEGVDLMTLKLQKQDLERRKRNTAYRHKTNRMFRRSCFLSEKNCVRSKPRAEGLPEEEQVPAGEVVLIVQVYKPMKMPTHMTKYRQYGFLSYKVQAEIAVLGCQVLRCLRSKIACISDGAVVGDFSDNPDRPHDPIATDVYKSGFFYIGDTFYNDMSDPSCRDYSEVIREWAAQNPKRQVGPFKSALMEESTFEDLELRLGYPYVYVHQGYCEHLIVFSDMRIIHPSDSQSVRDYPMVRQTFPLGKEVLCMLCRKTSCSWVVYGNERVTDDPFFFCKPCFKTFNYNSKDEKIGNFRAHPFMDWNVVR